MNIFNELRSPTFYLNYSNLLFNLLDNSNDYVLMLEYLYYNNSFITDFNFETN